MSKKNHTRSNHIKDVLKRIKVRSLPTVIETARLDEIIDAFESSRHSKVIYVVGADNKFLGIIDFKDISKHIFFHYHEPKLHSRELIRIITSEYARDFIKKESCSALLNEEFESVLKRMLHKGVEEIPVLTENGKIVADITIVDMIEYYMHITGRDKLGIHPE